MHYRSSVNLHRLKPKESWWHKIQKIASPKKRNFCRINRHYDTISLTNPWGKTESDQSHLRNQLATVALPCILVFWAYLLFYTPYFSIHSISVSGATILNTNTLEGQIEQLVSEQKSRLCPANNFFCFPTERIIDFLKKEYPALQQISVNKIFPTRVVIAIEEPLPAAIYSENGTSFILDNKGHILRPLLPIVLETTPTVVDELFASNTSSNTLSIDNNTTDNRSLITKLIEQRKIERLPFNIPVIINSTNFTTTTTETISQEKIEATVRLDFLLKQQGIVRPLGYVVDREVPFFLTLVSDKPWIVRFDLRGNVETQVENLKIISTKEKPTSYVDLRYGERVFWK